MLVIFVAWSTLVAGQQRQHLLRSLATFSVAKGSVFAEEDRATIEAAIQEWYGGAEAGAGGEDGKGDAGGGGEAAPVRAAAARAAPSAMASQSLSRSFTKARCTRRCTPRSVA